MERERDRAVGTGAHLAARLAPDAGGEAAAIQEEDRLFLVIERRLDRAVERERETLVPGRAGTEAASIVASAQPILRRICCATVSAR